MNLRSGTSTLSALALLLAAGSAGGQEKTSKEAAAMAERVNKPVVYQVEGMNRVRVRRDLVPVRPKDWGIYKSWGALIAASGMAAVTFNHRVGFPDPNLSQGNADVLDVIAFVRERAADFGIDPERIALAAYSAGGPMLAAPIREPRPYVRCLVAFYAFLDLRQSALHRKFLSEDQIREFSPAVALSESTGKVPPIFVARAGKDQIPDLLPGLDRFVAEALGRNVALVLHNQPDGERGFDNQGGDPRSREIVREAVEFLRRNLAAR